MKGIVDFRGFAKSAECPLGTRSCLEFHARRQTSTLLSISSSIGKRCREWPPWWLYILGPKSGSRDCLVWDVDGREDANYCCFLRRAASSTRVPASREEDNLGRDTLTSGSEETCLQQLIRRGKLRFHAFFWCAASGRSTGKKPSRPIEQNASHQIGAGTHVSVRSAL